MALTPSPHSDTILNETNFFNHTNNTESCGGGASNAASGDFWIGVTASLLGSVILNLGLNIQKLAFVRNSKVPYEERKPVYKNWLWMLGFFIFIFGNGGDAIGLTFTAQSIITPIGAIALVSNLFFARLLVGEKIGCKTSIAIIFIIVGVVLIVFSGNTDCSSVSLKIIKKKFIKPKFLIFALFHMGTLVALLLYTCAKERKLVAFDPIEKKKIAVGLNNFTSQEKLRLRLAYPLLASCFAAWTVLLSKCVGELTKESVRSGTSEFLHFESFLILGGFVCSLPCQVMYINKGLSLFESSYIIPIFYSTWLIGSILMGALFWDEFAKTVVWQFLVFAGGVSCVMIGVVLLQQREISSESEQGGTEFDSAAGQHGRSGSSGSGKSGSGGIVDTKASIGDVLERRNTFFTRAAAAVVSSDVTRKVRGGSTSSSISNSTTNGVTQSKEVAVEMLEF